MPLIKPTLAAAALALIAACPLQARDETAPRSSPPASESATVLRIGMGSADVRQAIGKPAEIKPFGSSELKAEIWVYRRLLKETKAQEATGTWNRPYFDIVANTMKHVPEPIYTNVTVRVHEVTHLLFVEDKLVESKRFPEESKSYE